MLTRLLRVNNRYKDNLQSLSEFSINIPSPQLERVLKCSLQSAVIPRLFGNIYNGINIFRFYKIQPGGTNLFTYTIPAGQYNATELAAVLNNLVGESLEITYNETSKRFVFINLSAATEYYIDTTTNDSICVYLGLSSDFLQALYFQTPSFFIGITSENTAQNPPSLQGPSTVYVQSTIIANNSTLDVFQNGIMLPIVVPINCSTVPYGFVISYVTPTDTMWLLDYASDSSGISLRDIRVSLTDVFGNLLPFPDNAFSDFIFKLYFQDSK
jgi:hypothetical protein